MPNINATIEALASEFARNILQALRGASLSDLTDGDIKYHTDFRRVYATLLDNWLGVDSKGVLGEKFETMALIDRKKKAPAGGPPPGNPQPFPPGGPFPPPPAPPAKEEPGEVEKPVEKN